MCPSKRDCVGAAAAWSRAHFVVEFSVHAKQFQLLGWDEHVCAAVFHVIETIAKVIFALQLCQISSCFRFH